MMNLHKALIYCRVSTKKQDTEGSGLSSQEQRCKEFASMNNLEVEYIFQDAFSGAGDFLKRPAMKQLLEYADSNPKTSYVVIFDDLKRFARDTVFHIKLRQEFRCRNLIPKCLNFNFEDTPEGEFIETIIAAQGQLEREQNRRQVFQKMKARFERGIYCIGGHKLYGYKFEKNQEYGGKILTVNKIEADIIKEAFEGFANGKFYYLKDVANFLIKSNVFISKKKIREDTIRLMFSNILYTGYVEYPKWNIKRVKGVHEAIISYGLFDQVQLRLSNKSPIVTGKKMDSDFPLRGLVTCSHCSKYYTGSWSTGRSKKYPFYRCMGNNCPYKTKSIQQMKIHTSFEELLQTITPNKEIVFIANEIIKEELDKRAKESDTYINSIKTELKEISERKYNLIQLISKTPHESIARIYEEQIKELHDLELRLNHEIENPDIVSREMLEPALKDAFETIKCPYSYWLNKELEQKKLMVKTLFKDNLIYDPITGFGTAQKCYYLRFFDEIEAKIDSNFVSVHCGEKNWNLGTLIADIANFNLDELIHSIRSIAKLR